MQKNTIAVLYIATGRYLIFWDFFYNSAEKFLLNNCEKHYFVFTDNIEFIEKNQYENVTVIPQNKLGWPYDTLMRFDIFLKIEAQLKKFDFIFFFNANTEFLKPILINDFLITSTHENYIFAIQPHLFHLKKDKLTYDRNPKSLAYMDKDQGSYYFTGALNGGRAEAYLKMCHLLSANIQTDLNNDVIALWHDESHLNKFALNRTDIKVLPPYFTRGETEYWKVSSKIMFSDKSHYRFGGHEYLRGLTETKISQEQWMSEYGQLRKKYKFRFKQFIKSVFMR